MEFIKLEHLQRKIEKIKKHFYGTEDLIDRSFCLRSGTKFALFYFESLTDVNILKENVITPLLEHNTNDMHIFSSNVITTSTKLVSAWDEIIEEMLDGNSVLLLDGVTQALVIDTKGGAERTVMEPVSEMIIQGPHDGFIENISKNIGLIRKYVPSSHLTATRLKIGRRTPVKGYLVYLKDMASETIVKEVENRIKNIKIDTILNVGELSNVIKDQRWTPFPQAYISERPDAIARHILEGRIAVLIDRSPGVMVVPVNLMCFFHPPDDYNIHWLICSFLRLLRFLGFIIAMFLPAIYIATVSFHFEIIPLNLYINIAASRAEVPFYPLTEAIIMEITLEMLREAGVRIPQPIGQTIGIVGGIVIGQAAIEAGLVSNTMVVIVSITAIASFLIANYDLANCARLIRFPIMILASCYGILGIVSGIIMLMVHLVTISSFGAPYVSFCVQNIKNEIKKFSSSKILRLFSASASKQMGNKGDIDE
ncbi:spore germination protein [Bacillus paranthracis]|uniref:spore germination protein n=1 Tax=Bacillus paranthracis TaxID=2026186 RepID=UPI000200F85B|nr:spore germination protein [Bacillus paranthracis]ADY24998.1 spore germination protein [Bacillus thuringiensis serovar finitimus YBT-020]MRC74941.1 spore germination protein [Bacillus thuringiensis]OTX77459.1 spore germination protein [Bacillus thuringiensis serovar finitimus]MCR6801204.1 spore germination protein [Bacillus paranthracis]MEC3361163.1 spore germination protein [Bacillus paranthracis]